MASLARQCRVGDLGEGGDDSFYLYFVLLFRGFRVYDITCIYAYALEPSSMNRSRAVQTT